MRSRNPIGELKAGLDPKVPNCANPMGEEAAVWEDAAVRMGRSAVTPGEVSLSAEVLLFAVDPGQGGLLPHSRRRFRRALAATRESGYGLPGAAWRARRTAMGELARAELLRPESLQLADRPRATARFRAVCECLEQPSAADSRAWELLVLLAWSGVLAQRLSKGERRVADRRLRGLFKTADDDLWGFPGGEYAMPAWVPRLGGIAALASQIDLFDSPGVTDFGSDSSGFKMPYGG